MANWVWSSEPLIRDLDPNGPWAKMNGQPFGSMEPVSRTVFITLKYTSDDPKDAARYETIFGVELGGADAQSICQWIADKAFGRCNALTLSDAANAALRANPPAPDNFVWSFDPDVLAQRVADNQVQQLAGKYAATKVLADAGSASALAALPALLEAGDAAVVAAASAQDVIAQKASPAPILKAG